MQLSGHEQLELQQALLDAFRRPEDLAQVVTFGLDQNLFAITPDGTLEERVFALVEWAEAHGRLPDLVQAARTQNPGNPALADFATRYATRLSGGGSPADPAATTTATARSGSPAHEGRQALYYGGGAIGILLLLLIGWQVLGGRGGGSGTPTPTATTVAVVATATAAAPTTTVPLPGPPSPTATAPAGPLGRIAFTSRRANGRDDVYVLDLAHPTPTRLTTEPGDDFNPIWSPDARQIAFDSDRGNASAVYLMGADGTNPTPVVTYPAGQEPRLTWSPDSRFLALIDSAAALPLQLFDIPGHATTPVAINAAGGKRDPAWSPDATLIAFTLNTGGRDRIAVVNSRGGTPTLLTDDPAADDFLPAWAPEGDRIAYTHCVKGAGQCDINVMARNGTGVLNLTQNPADDNAPTWSPDGRWIAFASHRDPEANRYDLYVLDVTHPEAPPIRLTDRSWNGQPAWAPLP